MDIPRNPHSCTSAPMRRPTVRDHALLVMPLDTRTTRLEASLGDAEGRFGGAFRPLMRGRVGARAPESPGSPIQHEAESMMSKIRDVAERFFVACEEGKGWDVCQEFCHPDATFSAQAPALAEITTVQGYTD